MKAYTDIHQSKKLAEILPIESADMWWSKNFIYYNPTAAIGISAEYSNVYTYKFGEDDIPCWSLVALLEVLPERVIMPYYAPYLQKEDGKYHTAYGNEDLLCKADNPIDACYEMILKLKEKDLL